MINKKYLKNLRSKEFNDKNDFIFDLYSERIIDSLDIITLKFKKILILGNNGTKLQTYLKKKFKNASFTICDYSIFTSKNTDYSNLKTNIIDLDFWEIEHDKYDLILSNFLLNLVDNFENQINKIIKSLSPNGLFLATLPTSQNFVELRTAMIKTDIQLYDGAYNRFNPTTELQEIIESLKKNNFKIPLVNLEKINLEYKNYSKLLQDVHSMNLSYFYLDKKNTFEKKNYFQKLENNHQKNLNKNYKLSSHFFIISGWKDHSSLQKPLRPGEAKNKLKDYL